jgi:hypothetical protein
MGPFYAAHLLFAASGSAFLGVLLAGETGPLTQPRAPRALAEPLRR